MKRSPQLAPRSIHVSFDNPTPTITTTSTTTTMSTLPVPPPYFHRPHQYHHNGLTRSPTRSKPTNNNNNIDITEDIDDDLFGTKALKKNRPKRPGSGGGKKNSFGREGEERNGGNPRHTKRWALVQIMEQHAKNIYGHVIAVRKWCADFREGLPVLSADTLRAQPAPKKQEGFVSEGERNSSVVLTANSSAQKTGSGRSELTSESLVQEAKMLCGSYIYHRLSSKGLMSKRVGVAPHCSLVADELCTAGQELERLYPRIYSDVSRRISMTMTSPQIVRRALTSVLEGIFRSGVTWARVVAMVAIAAAFAEECVVQGHPKFVEDVVMCVGHFVTLRLTDWLLKQGGWDGFPTSQPPVMEKSPDGTGGVVYIVSILSIFAIFFLFLYTLCVTVT